MFRTDRFKLASPTSLATLFTLALLATAPACTSPALTSEEGQVGVLESGRWVDVPDLVAFPAAVGAAPIVSSRGEFMARTAAEADGRAKLAAALEAEIRQMFEGMGRTSGDLVNEDSFTELVDNSVSLRQFVNTTVSGARPLAYKKRDGTLFALVAFKDADQVLENLMNASRAQLLKMEALMRNEALKKRLFEQMDAYAAQREVELQEETQRLAGLIGA